MLVLIVSHHLHHMLFYGARIRILNVTFWLMSMEWMQGFFLKLPYNCYEYMQIDLSKNNSSYIFWDANRKCHQMVLSSLFLMHNSALRLSAIKGNRLPFDPGGGTGRRNWKESCENEKWSWLPHEIFWVFCFWHLDAQPSHIISVGCGRIGNWFLEEERREINIWII